MRDWSRTRRIIVVLGAAPIMAGIFVLVSKLLFVVAFVVVWLNVGDGYGVPLPPWVNTVETLCTALPVLGFVGTLVAALTWALRGSRPVPPA